MTGRPPASPRHCLAVVTGASSGIGAATARELAMAGYHVLAGVRRSEDADALQATNLEPIMLDITDEAAIAALVQRIDADPERRPLGALVNNAGVAINAPLEAYKLDALRRLFEVNLFGHVAMIQALLPALIESRGTIVNISSVGGKVAMPTYGPYAGTKFALEAISDSLRREVAPLGVRVVVVEPGAITTGMLKQVGGRGAKVVDAMTPIHRDRSAALMHAVVAQAEASVASGAPPEEAARIIAHAIISPRPRTRYTVGRGTGMIVKLTRLVSDRVLDRILAANLKPYFR
ncbi:SDR family oxidoreductase [Sphingomonas suaedae]|uniref:SDR family oxidoreductase n=1 Tax=Sphingomonas suaedae TaxID=2599297 RepID=A0A518RHM4_9SPHN|nr:SDR family oxidoreductase [Sphingomonas suaedae]QDX26934.1 SDR family oxidoreductase [Sphingomonas suaedae]